MLMFTLEALGISNEDLIERVVDKLVDEFLGTDDSDEFSQRRIESIDNSVRKLIQERVDVGIQKVLETHIIPSIETRISELVIQETNEYGEKKGKKAMTFTEFAVQKAQDFLEENVDYDGKPKCQKGHYHWIADSTRLIHLVKKQISTDIEAAVMKSLTDATSAVANSLMEVTRLKLNEAAKKLRIEVSSRP